MGNFNLNADFFLGSQELNRLMKSLDESGFRKILLQNSLGFGIVNNSIDGNFTNFLVEQGTNVGTIKISDGVAIDAAGQLITYYATDNISLTNDNVWRWLTITHQYDKREQGVCSIDANGNLSFPGGELLTILRGIPNNPVKVKFTNATTNIQEYEVLEVIDDENATLTGDFSAESNLRLAVVGAFTPDTVTPETSKYPYQYDGCDLQFTLETVLNTPPTLTADYQFTIARVKRNGAAITIQDKRIQIYKSKADFNLSSISSNDNPLIGVEAVKYNSNFTPRDQNLVYLAWGFRSSNWTIDSSANRLTLIAGSGGKFKSTSDFTDGDFDGWRVYAKDGSYSVVKQSSLSATQINLILDTLDVDKFTDTAQQIVVVPDADEIELIFTADPDDATDLLDKRFIFHINNGQVIVPLVIYATPLCLYNFKYRYKSFKVWSEATAIPSDLVSGYLVEADFDNNGVQTASARQTYTSSATQGFITLILASNTYSNRIASVETGDLFGVEYLEVNNGSPVVSFQVGDKKQTQIVHTVALPTGLGTPYTLTINHYFNLRTDLPTDLNDGNSFIFQFKGDYVPGMYSIIFTQDYVNPGNVGTVKYTLVAGDFTQSTANNLFFRAIFDGTDWQVSKFISDLGGAGFVSTSRTLIAGNGLAGGGDLSADRTFSVNVDSSSIEINADTLRVKALGITAGMLAAGAAITNIGYTPPPTTLTLTAGSGLSGGGDLSTNRTFDVNVDNSSIEINADTLRVKALGITDAMLAGSISAGKLAAGVAVANLGYTPANSTTVMTAGDGLSGGGDLSTGRTLTVNFDNSTIETSSDTLRVKADGITSTHIANSAVGNTELAANAVSSSKIADGAAIKVDVLSVAGLWVKVVNIGDWDITAGLNLTIVDGGASIDYKKIRSVSVIIRDDADTDYRVYPGAATVFTDSDLSIGLAATPNTFTLVARAASNLNSVSFNSTGYNRGWITFTYTP